MLIKRKEAEDLVGKCEKNYNHTSGRVISALWFVRWLYDNNFKIQKNRGNKKEK